MDEAKPLEGPRYRVHRNGTLQVSGATEEDAGAYSCWVENAEGKTAVTASLDVRSKSGGFPFARVLPGPARVRSPKWMWVHPSTCHKCFQVCRVPGGVRSRDQRERQRPCWRRVRSGPSRGSLVSLGRPAISENALFISVTVLYFHNQRSVL